MELKQSNVYIVRRTIGISDNIFKMKILELTATSIFYENIDSDYSKREELRKFNLENVVLENLGILISTSCGNRYAL